jgi:cytochrome c553
MRRSASSLLGGLVVVWASLSVWAGLAGAAERPGWAFPVTDKVQPPVQDDGQPKTAPGSDKTYTRQQIDDLFNPPDWYPDMHPPMPQVVAHGVGTAVRACAACHLPTGTGHDESAYVAALPAPYFVRQMADYKTGARKGSGSMTAIAKAITDDDVHAAADYFAALKPRPWIKVVETDTVPKTYVGPGNKRLRLPDGGSEPLGARIIEIPEDENVVLNRDPRLGFIAYVPKGSIAAGEALVTTGGNGKTVACTLCHGPALTGLAEVPPIAGRQANYVVRQLFSFQDGSRTGAWSPLMAQAVANLAVDDMLAIAAYTASRQPD